MRLARALLEVRDFKQMATGLESVVARLQNSLSGSGAMYQQVGRIACSNLKLSTLTVFSPRKLSMALIIRSLVLFADLPSRLQCQQKLQEFTDTGDPMV